jgi:hypothetical protein
MSALKAAPHTGKTDHSDEKFMTALTLLAAGNLLRQTGHDQVTKLAAVGIVMMLTGGYALAVLVRRHMKSPHTVHVTARGRLLMGLAFFITCVAVVAPGFTSLWWVPGNDARISMNLLALVLFGMCAANFCQYVALTHPEDN